LVGRVMNPYGPAELRVEVGDSIAYFKLPEELAL
jgi:hypothetical protein